MSDTCLNCGGLIGESGKVYGYAGKWCYCQINPLHQFQRPASRENQQNPIPDSVMQRLKRDADLVKERDIWRQEALAAREIIEYFGLPTDMPKIFQDWANARKASFQAGLK